MKKSSDANLVAICVIALYAVCFLAGFICLWIGNSYFEARAYNNVTGKEVSTFDAMFLELRVTNE